MISLLPEGYYNILRMSVSPTVLFSLSHTQTSILSLSYLFAFFSILFHSAFPFHLLSFLLSLTIYVKYPIYRHSKLKILIPKFYIHTAVGE